MPQKNYNNNSREYITLLRQRLTQVTGAWSVEDYKAFITFYSKILPRLMKVERCTVFIMEIGSQKICSLFGTGLDERFIEPPLEGSIVGQVISSGISRIENSLKSIPGFHSYIDEQTGFISHNALCSPIKSITGNSATGAIQLLNKQRSESFTLEDMQLLEEIAHFLSISIESLTLNQEILRIASSLNEEVDRLHQSTSSNIIAESIAMREVLELAQVVSKTPVNVLLQGQNGTGKELIAKMIHNHSERKNTKFIPVNCASIPESLVESEFFGHQKGAFTGAKTTRKGLFEEASGGTLFLDEIGEMPLSVQPKILRAIQEREGRSVGGNTPISYDFRLISATNRDLADEVKNGRFREDLYFRLFSVEILLPPLRQRREDIMPLALNFLEKTNQRFGKAVKSFSPSILELFYRYPWPGNVRQLLKEVERLVALTDDDAVIIADCCSRELLTFQTLNEQNEETQLSLPYHQKRLEVDLITRAMQQSKGNKSEAARLLNISRQGLLKKIKRLKLDL